MGAECKRLRLDEYTSLDAWALAQLVRRREVSVGELIELALDATAAVNSQVNAVIEVYDDQLTRHKGPNAQEWPSGALAGVPMMVKDIGCMERGRRMECGSRLLKGWRAPADSELTRRFRAAGLVTVGRTTTSEFAGLATVETAIYGSTRNPWSVAHSSGGSSGGAAVAVACGVVPVAHGTDAGGSIRIPASCCGVVGLKPSRGLVSLAPDIAGPGWLGVSFALTRSVRDAAALLDAVAGSAPGDAFRVTPQASYSGRLHEPQQLRIAFATEHLLEGTTDPEVSAAVERVAHICEGLGHHVTRARPRFDCVRYAEANLVLWSAVTAATVDRAASETGRRPGPETLEGHTRAWVEHGRRLSAPELVAALAALESVSRDVAGLFEEVDVLLSATLPTQPIQLGLYDPYAELDPSWYYAGPIGSLGSTTALFNCTGQPAISLPLAQSSRGLPIGIHLAGRFGEERALLRLAASLEEALPWSGRRPAVHAAGAIGSDLRNAGSA